MKKQLLILRHGKSDWSVDSNDFNRPLNKRGKQAVKNMAIYLQDHQLIPDTIISSPATRAADTAKRLCQTINVNNALIKTDARLYAAGLNDLLSVLADCPSNTRRVLLVGHNPGLEILLDYLHNGSLPIPSDGKCLVTAALAILDMPDNWNALSKACASVLSITRPADL